MRERQFFEWAVGGVLARKHAFCVAKCGRDATRRGGIADGGRGFRELIITTTPTLRDVIVEMSGRTRAILSCGWGVEGSCCVDVG